MRRCVRAFLLLSASTALALGGSTSRTSLAQAKPTLGGVQDAFGRLPLAFEVNQGQSGHDVEFLARGPNYTLFLTRADAVLSLRGDHAPADVFRMKLAGSHAAPRPAGLEALPGTSNYLIGNDPAKWRTGVATYRKVRYESVYPGIDLVYYGNLGELEYDFVVAPGADPDTIRLAVDGADDVTIDPSGDVVLRAAAGDLRLHKPVVYQERDGVRREIASGYVIDDAHRIGFQVAPYDRTRPLTIDPTVVFTTFLAGTGPNSGVFGMAVDGQGSAYVTGFTNSTDFPTAGAEQRTYGGGTGDAFVAKLDASGTLLYSTFLGGAGSDIGQGIVVDASRNAYVVGDTLSNDFPVTAGAFQKTRGGALANVFVIKLDPTGTRPIYSTFLGGTGADDGVTIALGTDGSAYVAGSTQSPNFPATPGALRTTAPSPLSAFVTRLNPAGSALLYSTYLGGSSFDFATDIVVDGVGNAYVTGQTGSSNFPISPGAFQTTLKGTDAFVTKLNPTGTGVLFSTFLGGTGVDQGNAIAVDGLGDVYVTGNTSAPDFPTTVTAFQKTFKGVSDIFVTKLNPTGTGLVFSTYLGGSGADSSGGIVLWDSNGDGPPTMLIAGNTIGQSDFPSFNDIVACNGQGGSGPSGPLHSGIVVGFNGDGSQIIISTCTTPPGDFLLNSIAIGPGGNVFVAGRGTSAPFPGAVERGLLIRLNDVPTGPCSYSLEPTDRIFDAQGGIDFREGVTTSRPDCPWIVTSDQSWIHIPQSSGVGNGEFSYAIDANPVIAPRLGTINVQGQKVTATQTNCTYTWNATSLQFEAQQTRPLEVSVAANSGCQWDASSPAPWINILPSGGVGTGSIVVSAYENTGSKERTATVHVTGGGDIRVTQHPK